MSQTLEQIAQTLRNTDNKVQLIYAFNGSGKTRLSRAFKELIDPRTEERADDHLLKYSTTMRLQRICFIGTMILRATSSAS